MPIVYNPGQHGAPSPDTSPSVRSISTSTSTSTSTSRSSSSSSGPAWVGLDGPWLYGAVLFIALLLIRHRRGRSRAVSMSQAETPSSSKSATPPLKRSPDERLRAGKEGVSSTSPSSWSPPTIATVIKHGHHASGTAAGATTISPMRNTFPYPNLPSPTLSPMMEENEEEDREIPFMEKEASQKQDVSLPPSFTMSSSSATTSTTATATASSQLPTPPRRRSYTKTSIVPISPPRAYTFPITADESEFRFGTGSDPPQQQQQQPPLMNPGGPSLLLPPPPPPPSAPLVFGIELAEEVIIAAEGWRRHTRVYGGGVCRACEESEEQMRLMGVRPVEMDA